MYLLIKLLIVFMLCLDFGVNLTVRAETEASLPLSQLLVQQEQLLQETQTKLKEEQAALPESEQKFQANVATLKTMSEVSTTILEGGKQGLVEAELELEKIKTALPITEASLDKYRARLKELGAQLANLSTSQTTEVAPVNQAQLGEGKNENESENNSEPPSIPVASSSRLALESELATQKQLMTLTETQLTLSKQRVELAAQQLKLAAAWNDQVQTAYWQKPVEERQRLVQEVQQLLERKKAALLTAQKELPTKIASLETMQSTEIIDAVAQAALDKEAASVEVDNLRLELQTTESNLERFRVNLKELQNTLEALKKYSPATKEVNQAEKVVASNRQLKEVENKVQLHQKLVEQEEKHLAILTKRIEIARQYSMIMASWYAALQNVSQNRKQQDLESLIQSKTAPLLARIVELRKQLEGIEDSASRILVEAQIQVEEVNVQSSIYQLKLDNLREQFNQLQTTLKETGKIASDKFNNLQALVLEFQGLQNLLKDKIGLLKQQQEIVKKRQETLKDKLPITQAQNLLTQLIEQLQSLLLQGQSALDELRKAYLEYQRRTLFSRRELPNDLTEWQNLLKDLNQVPQRFGQQLQFTWQDLQSTFQQLAREKWLLISIVSLIWLMVFFLVKTSLVLIFEQLSRLSVRTFLANSFLHGLRLLHLNALTIAIGGLLFLLIWIAQPSQSSMQLFWLVGLTWVGVKFVLTLAWLWLSDKEIKTENRSKIYRQLHWSLIFMGILTVITGWGHLRFEKYDLNTPVHIVDLFDSGFMLFLSLMVWPVMKIRHTLLVLLVDRVKSYWWLVIRVITLLFPLSILAVAVLGVIGYLNLGWKVAAHASWFLLVLTGWLIAQGLLEDSIMFLKNFALKHSQYGLLWTQDILPLFQRLVWLILMGVAIITFFWLNGWYTKVGLRESAVIDTLEQWFLYSLFKVGNTEVKIDTLLLSLLTLWIVFWFGSWSRRVTYRWIYLGVTDLGMRHSLSVFTQYAVVLIGLLITLRMLGLDLTTLTIFAGALGVGIGFGLQNIANNFVSGILLLIERPLRTGDIVKIGSNYEGMVTEIGIRSLTIQTRDLEEVIVPNAELISNAFTNWTHSNPLRRLTSYVGISYNSDPNQAIAVVNQVLQELPVIVKEPPFQVTLWEFADSALILRIDVFINLLAVTSVGVKGQMLLNIWNSFKDANIKIPYPQREVYVKTWPSSAAEKREEHLEPKEIEG